MDDVIEIRVDSDKLLEGKAGFWMLDVGCWDPMRRCAAAYPPSAVSMHRSDPFEIDRINAVTADAER